MTWTKDPTETRTERRKKREDKLKPKREKQDWTRLEKTKHRTYKGNWKAKKKNRGKRRHPRRTEPTPARSANTSILSGKDRRDPCTAAKTLTQRQEKNASGHSTPRENGEKEHAAVANMRSEDDSGDHRARGH